MTTLLWKKLLELRDKGEGATESFLLEQGITKQMLSHVEYSHKVSEGQTHSARVHVALHGTSGMTWTRDALIRYEETNAITLDKRLMDEIVSLLPEERVIGTALGVDERVDANKSRVKFWAALSEPTESAWQWLYQRYEPPHWLMDHTREYLLIGVDMFLNGKTRLKPYLTFNSNIEEVLVSAGGIAPTIQEHLKQTNAIHFAESQQDNITIHAHLHKAPFLEHCDHFRQLDAYYSERDRSLKFVSIPLVEAHAGFIQNYNLYY